MACGVSPVAMFVLDEPLQFSQNISEIIILEISKIIILKIYQNYNKVGRGLQDTACKPKPSDPVC